MRSEHLPSRDPLEPADPAVERFAARLREPVELSAEVERVVLERLRAEVADTSSRAGRAVSRVGSNGAHWASIQIVAGPSADGTQPAPAWQRLVGSRTGFGVPVRLGRWLVLAAGIAATFGAGLLVGRWSSAPTVAASELRPVEFALRIPADSAVVLVGDFNDWNASATPLRRAADGVWSVTVPLRPGRYRYTFIVDGTRWRPDPAAPRALEDDFGAPTSVITIAQR